jgi:hypothetical protein
VKSFFSRLFGSGKTGLDRSAAGETVEYKGYRIRPAPFRADAQFQTAGFIEKDFPEGPREHRFIRAEKHASAEEAASFSVTKAKQIIDGSGDAIFDSK